MNNSKEGKLLFEILNCEKEVMITTKSWNLRGRGGESME